MSMNFTHQNQSSTLGVLNQSQQRAINELRRLSKSIPIHRYFTQVNPKPCGEYRSRTDDPLLAKQVL